MTDRLDLVFDNHEIIIIPLLLGACPGFAGVPNSTIQSWATETSGKARFDFPGHADTLIFDSLGPPARVRSCPNGRGG
jgi:hypothetical protein